MNAGLSNLTSLKAKLLAASLRQDTDYDDAILAIGLGCAAQVDQFCNRQTVYANPVVDIFRSDRRHWYLRATPAVAITECAKKDSELDGWVEFPLPPNGSSLIQMMDLASGYVMFVALQGYYFSQLRITYSGGYWFDSTEDGSGVQPPATALLPPDLQLAWFLQCQNVWKRWDKLGGQIAQDPEKTGAMAQLELCDASKEILRKYIRYQIS